MKNIEMKKFTYSSYLKPILTEIFDNINDVEFNQIGYIDKLCFIPTKGNFMDIEFYVSPRYSINKHYMISVNRGICKSQYNKIQIQNNKYYGVDEIVNDDN